MRGKSMFVATALAGALLLGGFVAAASPAPSVTTTSHLSASLTSGTTSIVIYADSDVAASTVVLTGAIGDFGTAASVFADGTPNPDHDADLNLALTQGSFRLDVVDLDKKIVAAFGSVRFQPSARTCSGMVRVTGSVPIVPGSGTGLYQGISGSFDVTFTVDEVDSKSSCATGTLLAQIVITSGSGTVRF